jgi:hypothetical protein
MRKLIVLAMVAGLIGAGVYTRDASAGATVDLLFVGKNGNPIAATDTVTAVASDTLTMAVLLTSDQILVLSNLSLTYDTDLGDELDIVSAIEWVGMGLNMQNTITYLALQPGVPNQTATFIGSFDGATNDYTPPILGLPAGPTYQLGTVTWHATANVSSDGADIFSGLFDVIVDGFGDAGFNNIDTAILFRSATVNLVPEPGTASLLGLVGLVLAGRRSRS